ncbi:DUF3278 domain-containing protein [Salipaludibacillus sp. HK11]|uniref:DUF3278 domain-containing protein n=1 Tax=Salipaludibacillus sp. HK11 TaxID=3394320 RepID=UPI0039FC250D
MKSWITFLLPSDEYKEKKMLYFYSEAAILLFFSLIMMVIINEFFNIDVEIVLLVLIAIFLFYVTTRYIVSGIEYTDVTSEQAYKKEIRVISIRTIGFVVIFISFYMIFIEIPVSRNEWFEIVGLLLSSSFIMFFASYLSLRRSYKKNNELL